MAAKLNVLVLESERGAARPAQEELETNGHSVVRCHEPGAAVFPCNALIQGRGCPLDATVVDVALVVRAHPTSLPALREHGVTCAVKQHVPLVVAGSRARNPYEAYAVEAVEHTSDVVDACERAAAAPLPAHSAAAARALEALLAQRAITASPRVAVRRRDGALVVHVADAGALDDGAKGMAAVRMMAAIRALDHASRGIDVTFDAS